MFEKALSIKEPIAKAIAIKSHSLRSGPEVDPRNSNKLSGIHETTDKLFAKSALQNQYDYINVCKNADISGCADSQLVDSSLTLKCQYIGKRDVTAIYWYNGSNLDALALKPGFNVPHCDVHSRIDIFFDPHRINYTCNASSDVYTLTINPLQKLDNNVTWSCTFIDPAPDHVKADCTIHLSETTDVTAGDGRISSPSSTVTFIIVCISPIVVYVTLIVIILQIITRSPYRRGYRRYREQNAEVGLSMPEVLAEETDHHREQEPTLSELGIRETLTF